MVYILFYFLFIFLYIYRYATFNTKNITRKKIYIDDGVIQIIGWDILKRRNYFPLKKRNMPMYPQNGHVGFSQFLPPAGQKFLPEK